MHQNAPQTRNPFLVLVWSCALFLLWQIVFGAGVALIAKWNGEDLSSLKNMSFQYHSTLLWAGLFSFFIVVPFLLLIIKFLWRRDWKWMYFSLDFRLLGYGSLLGIGLSILIWIILTLMGTVRLVGLPDRFSLLQAVEALAGYFFLMVFIGISEELFFRGMLTREWAARWDWSFAAITSSVCFGALHVLNIGVVSWFSGLRITFAGMIIGLVLVILMVRSQSLWLPIGFHFGWNFSLSALLGTTVSSIESEFGLLQTRLTGPDLLTGGKFGVEVSIITIIVFVAIILLHGIYRPGRLAGNSHSNAGVAQ